MDKINFEDGELIKEAYVVINGVEYPITEAEWKGNTPLSAFLLNKMQENIEKAINEKASKDVATTTTNGLMSSTDKAKLDNTLEFEVIEEFTLEE